MQNLKVGILTTLTVWIAACSPVNFNTVKNNDGVGVTTTVPPGQTCNVENIYRKTKIIFLVDTSGSNHDTTYNYTTNGTESTPPTDPNKSFRGGAINDFFSTYRHKTNFSWSMATFSGSTASPLLGGFSSDVAMSNAISNFYQVSDSGQTPYRPALSVAADQIGADPELNSADKPSYMVVLLSDGFPTDYNVNGTFQSQQMRSDVAALLGKAPGRVTLNTIFYGAADSSSAAATAKDQLQQIASAGSGQFASVNTSSYSSFKIEDVIARSSTTCTP